MKEQDTISEEESEVEIADLAQIGIKEVVSIMLCFSLKNCDYK